MNKKTLFIAAAVALLLAFVVGVLFYASQKDKQSTQLVDTNREALVRMHAPTLGKPDAPVVIVEFFDPACETCRAFYPLVKDILAANPDQIRLVLAGTGGTARHAGRLVAAPHAAGGTGLAAP